jgi:L-cysteine/cystine lyase
MTLGALTQAFPVLGRTAYLNAGSVGPMPAASALAIGEETRIGLELGRGLPYYERLGERKARARVAWSGLLGAPADELALTTGASDGITRALALLDPSPGDRVVTTDEEHPGVLGPLGALVRRRGVDVVIAPWDDVVSAITPQTRLVVISHVSWLRGRVADLAAIGAAGVPIVVDAAQSAGAIPVDLAVLRRQGVVAYAAAGQKWTCGPVGTGALWVDPAWAPDGGAGVWPVYDNLSVPQEGLEAQPWPDARRLDAPSISSELLAGSLAALQVLSAPGWDVITGAAVQRAAEVAEALRAAGREVNARGASTLVSWRSPVVEAEVARGLAAGVVLRGFPGQPWVRASLGAWTTDAHVERLLSVVAG